MAFIALDDASGQMLGVVRLHDDNDGKNGAEFAVIVRSELKGHGLGWLLMQRMIEYAKAKGLKRVHGQVLSENLTMLQMCQELGFHLGPDIEAGVKVEVLDLGQVQSSAA
jgi:acetyltransferase